MGVSAAGTASQAFDRPIHSPFAAAAQELPVAAKAL